MASIYNLLTFGIVNPTVTTRTSKINDLIQVPVIICLTSWLTKNLSSTSWACCFINHILISCGAYLKPPFNIYSYHDWHRGTVRTDNKRRTRFFSGAKIRNILLGCIFLPKFFIIPSISLGFPVL